MNEEYLMQFFRYDHLPVPLRMVAKPFAELAAHIVAERPRNPERTVSLRHLLDAKEAAVRSEVFEAAARVPVIVAPPPAVTPGHRYRRENNCLSCLSPDCDCSCDTCVGARLRRVDEAERRRMAFATLPTAPEPAS